MQEEIEKKAKDMYPDNMGGLDQSSVERYRAGYEKGYIDCHKQRPAGSNVWVKASERLPDKPGKENEVIVRRDGYIGYGFRNFNEEKPQMYYVFGNKSFCDNEVEWLDESGQSKEGNKQIDRDWLNNALVEFALSYSRRANKDIANDAAEYLNDKLKEAGIEYVLCEEEKEGKERDEWIDVNDQLPDEGGRYWCYVEELTDLGISHFQWNCAYNQNEKTFRDQYLKSGKVTHWRELPPPPKQK